MDIYVARFKALNTDDARNNKNNYNMKTKVIDTFCKVVGILSSAMMTFFAGMFALISISALVVSVVEKDLFSVIASCAAGFAAYITWSIRKDVLR